MLESTLHQLKQESAREGFWQSATSAQGTLKKISQLEKELQTWGTMARKRKDVRELLDVAESGEEAWLAEAEREVVAFARQIDDLELQLLLSGEEDAGDAIMTIHPGAGGTESQDWAEILYRMYTRWIERRGFSSAVIDFQPGEEAGIKDVTLEIKGQYAYGLLKSETGVHRLVRISPFDAAARRHTSFASVFVYPAISEDVDVELRPEELRIDTFRAGGAGGQHVNKTDSAIRITHVPSGIVVQCQNERSQHKNKANALKVLKARLYQLKLEEQRASLRALESQKQDIAWGSQIRSYVFQPYTLVKDHRTKEEIGDVRRVMDGDIDPFIRSYLLALMSRKGAPAA